MKKPIEDGVIYEQKELRFLGFVLWRWMGKRLSTAALLRRLPGVE